MPKYTTSQIEAVRNLQKLHGVPGILSDASCVDYLDWHMANRTTVGSVAEAIADGVINGLSVYEQQFRKLSDLVKPSPQLRP